MGVKIGGGIPADVPGRARVGQESLDFFRQCGISGFGCDQTFPVHIGVHA
jgi:hypothetical protein